MDNEDDTPKGKKNLIGLCLIASNKSSINSDIHSDNEGNQSEPSYDDLACAIEKLGALEEKRNKKMKKHDVLIEPLHAEIARLKTLIPDDDSCKSCELVYAELTSLRNVQASTLEQLEAKKTKIRNMFMLLWNQLLVINVNCLS